MKTLPDRPTRNTGSSDAGYRTFVESISEGIWRMEFDSPVRVDVGPEEWLAVFGDSASIAECNDQLAQMLGFGEAHDLVGRRVADCALFREPTWRDALLAFRRCGFRLSDWETFQADEFGDSSYFRNNVVGILSDQRLVQMWGTMREVTAERWAEKQLLHNAFHDALTDLPNRALFMDRLERLIAHRKRNEQEFAVLFLDLDGFKAVNDNFGHVVGDDLLIAVASRLLGCVREEDTVARLGGDEFGILLSEINGPQDAIRVARRVQDALGPPILLDPNEFHSGASIGITLSQSRYTTPADMIKDADTAMYRAKADGPGRFEIFDHRVRERAVAELDLESDLESALENEQLLLHFQPIFSVESGLCIGVEALIRWQHPRRGCVSPADFIPLAEAKGLMVPFGWWVMRHAFRQVCEWHRRYPDLGSPPVSINLSARQLAQPDLASRTAAILKEEGLDPALLTVDVTERALMDSPRPTAETVAELQRQGIGITIDDFGTGYSSIGHLHGLHADSLKVDRSFIADMARGDGEEDIVRTMVGIGHNLGMEVVAEGVETEQQLESARRVGCDQAQGYFLSRPADAAATEAVLAAGASGSTR